LCKQKTAGCIELTPGYPSPAPASFAAATTDVVAAASDDVTKPRLYDVMTAAAPAAVSAAVVAAAVVAAVTSL